jgi:cytochrome c oxidase cbb3-type subunit 3
VQCHGSGAAGSKGYPNLNDDDWLWGGDMRRSTDHHARHPPSRNAETRMSQMPAFRDVTSPAEIGDVTAHVQSLSGKAG